MLRAVFLLPLITLAGCVTAPESRVYSVGEVHENLSEWHGRTVFVHGYVWGCEPRGPCGIADGPMASDGEAILNIGYAPDFAEMLAKARRYKVLIEAEVNAACRNNICTGNPSELIPNRLVRAY